MRSAEGCLPVVDARTQGQIESLMKSREYHEQDFGGSQGSSSSSGRCCDQNFDITVRMTLTSVHAETWLVCMPSVALALLEIKVAVMFLLLPPVLAIGSGCSHCQVPSACTAK
jgi:hypothetical protein